VRHPDSGTFRRPPAVVQYDAAPAVMLVYLPHRGRAGRRATGRSWRTRRCGRWRGCPAWSGPGADGPGADGPAGTVPGLDRLSPRERELVTLVTLVAQGRTDAQIAE